MATAHHIPGLRLDPDTSQIHGPAGTTRLTTKERDLLLALIREPGHVVSRQNLLQALWDVTRAGTARALDVHIATLRSKLAASSGPDGARIDTVRGTAPSPAGGGSSRPCGSTWVWAWDA